MNTTKILIALFLFTLPSVQKVCAQTDSKDVFITTSGSGSTIEDATQAALRSATEQAFGAFISSKTEMFNDQVVADQMASVSSGNVKSFEILNQDQLPDGRWGVTLKAIVSIDKLTSFVEAKGIAIEIKGGMFALNIKQQLLNEQGEIKAVAEMVGLLHEPMQIAFDYVIESGDPLSIDEESKYWAIPLKVSAICNKNMDFCANYFIKTLAALSLTAEEVETYKSLNKRVYPVGIYYNGATETYYLRKQNSLKVLNTLTDQWEFYTRLFTVESGMDESNGNGEGEIYKFSGRSNYDYDNDYEIKKKFINFLTAGQQVATFSWQDERTLSQIEQMTGYSVKPRGVVSQFKHGGFVVFEENGHGLVVSLFDLGNKTYDDAKTACAELTLNGYSDWRLPSEEEFESIFNNLYKLGFGNIIGQNERYWASSKGWLDFGRGYVDKGQYQEAYFRNLVRAVRSF